MKRLLSILMITILLIPLLSGCTPDELGFLQLNHEMANLEQYTAQGTLTWDTDLTDLVDPYSDDYTAVEELQTILEKEGLKSLSYEYTVNLSALSMRTDYFTKDRTRLLSLIMLKDTYYINADGLLDLLTRNNPEALAEMEAYQELMSLDGKYLAVPMSEFMDSGLSDDPLVASSSLQESIEQQLVLRKFMSDKLLTFAQTELSGHNPGLVTKAYESARGADVYSFSMNLDKAPMVALDLMLYLLDHLDGTEAFVTDLFTDPTLMALSEYPSDAETVRSDIHLAFDDIRTNLEDNRAQLLDAIEREKNDQELSGLLSSNVGSATLSTKVAKLGTNKFWSSSALSYEGESAGLPVKKLAVTTEMTLTGGKSITVTPPTDTLSFEDFNSRFPQTLTLEPDYDYATYEAGLKGTEWLDLTLTNVDGRFFIEYGQLPAHFRAPFQVTGNQVLVNGEALAMPGDAFKSGDILLISISALRKAGFTVTWDEEYRTITIEG